MLGKRRSVITNKRTVCRVVVSVYPGVKYPVAIGLGGFKVIVRFKIVHDKEVGGGKAPDRACPRTVGVDVIDFIDTPVVGGVPREFSGVIAF